MNGKLDFSPLDDELAAKSEPTNRHANARSRSSRAWKSRAEDPVRQMSVRMKESVYDRFRQHCELDRRSNGEMLEIMMEAFERELKDTKK